MANLSKALHDKLWAMGQEGDRLGEAGDRTGQIQQYQAAWKLVPAPKHDWEHSNWLVGGIAEAYYQLGDYEKALQYLRETEKCTGGNNSLTLFRIGQLLLDAGKKAEAKTYLQQAWEMSGGRVFKNADKKYQAAIGSSKAKSGSPADIQKKWKSGNSLARKGDYKKAIKEFQAGLKLVPSPATEQAWGMKLACAMGDCYYLIKQYEQAVEYLHEALKSPGGIGNAFVHLRLGESYFELGDKKRAADQLARAYMAGGKEVFEDEEKYFEFLKTKLRKPKGGW